MSSSNRLSRLGIFPIAASEREVELLCNLDGSSSSSSSSASSSKSEVVSSRTGSILLGLLAVPHEMCRFPEYELWCMHSAHCLFSAGFPEHRTPLSSQPLHCRMTMVAGEAGNETLGALFLADAGNFLPSNLGVLTEPASGSAISLALPLSGDDCGVSIVLVSNDATCALDDAIELSEERSESLGVGMNVICCFARTDEEEEDVRIPEEHV